MFNFKDPLFFRSFCIVFVFLGLCSTSVAQTDWESKFNHYSKLVTDRYNEPPIESQNLDEYLYWLDVKAKDRDDIDKILDELNRLSFQNPSDQEIKKWTQKFFDLQEKAQQSGNSTAEDGAFRLLFLDSYSAFSNSLWRIRTLGRPLFQKANETKFSTYMIHGRAKCMMNFIIGDIECSGGCVGCGLYSADCEVYFGYIDENGIHQLPKRDFNVLCEPRSEFVTYARGEPSRSTEWAFKWMADIRNEARWWKFAREEADAEDLMSQYNEETLCKNPPNDVKKGHKFYVDLAEKYKFDECTKYNKGFYGTLYGKVEVLQEGKKLDAPFAIVTVKDLSQTWNVTADKNGNYEIKNAILHKECGPFDISAVFEGERVDEKYEGILVKPDTTARQKKDLLIKSNKSFSWTGSLIINVTENYTCFQHEETDNGIIKELEEGMSTRKSAAISIWSGEFTTPPMGVSMQLSNDFGASGNASANYSEHSRTSFERTRGACPGSVTIKTSVSEGSAYCNLDQSKLIITLARNVSAVTKLADQMQNLNPNDLAKMQKQLEDMMKQTDESDNELDVVVQVNTMCMGTVYKEDKTEEENTCQGTQEPKINTGSGELPLIGVLAFNLKGTYKKGKRGDDIIFATYSNKRSVPNGKGKRNWQEDCPEIEIIENCTLNLVRRPDR
jgi:hypothetical protein